MTEKTYSGTAGAWLLVSIVALSLGMGMGLFSNETNFAWGAGTTVTASSTVVVGNAAPTISAVTLNGGSAITLTANTTTPISVAGTVTDNNGCAEITNGTTSVLVYRSGISSSTCFGAQNNQNCYKLTAFTATSSCSNSVTLNVTSTFNLYYFADATTASSSYNAQTWMATLRVTDSSGQGTSSMDSAGVELNVLTALNVTTSSINYGTLAASSTTGAVNQTATSTNAGNSSTTLRFSAIATLTSATDFIVTSSQRYATSTFTFPGGATQLTDSPVTVTGYFLTQPTDTVPVSQATFWGLEVPSGKATGTYSGVTLFTSLFQP